MLSRRSLPALAVMAFALAGCGSTEDAPRPTCPTLTTVDGADRLTRFGGTGRDLTDVDFDVEIAQLAGSCSYDDESIEIELQLRFIAARGPADTDRNAPFSYFVAIVDRDQQVLARERFDTAVEFSGNATRAGILEEVEQRIPLAGEQVGRDFVIYVGFEMSREEYDYNRRQAR